MNTTYLLRAWDTHYAPLAEATRQSVWSWCRNNKALLRETRIAAQSLHVAWAKLPCVIDALRDPGAIVIWCDADIAIIDPNYSLAQFYPTNGIAFSSDNHGLCSGFFIAHGEWASWFLATVMRLGPMLHGVKHEQDGIKLLAAHFPEAASRITRFNAVTNPDTPFQSQPSFAYHAWGCDCPDPAKLGAALSALASNWSRSTLAAAHNCRVLPPTPCP